ncbi:unnamed protein product [Linum trigynum]|uniref:Uncharacterized protein n=1 Tax=Linum trigynum TaxID=586398 RepID=A0AAV2CUW9_9ROSI
MSVVENSRNSTMPSSDPSSDKSGRQRGVVLPLGRDSTATATAEPRNNAINKTKGLLLEIQSERLLSIEAPKVGDLLHEIGEVERFGRNFPFGTLHYPFGSGAFCCFFRRHLIPFQASI